jgi:hypothetical protein
MHRNLSVLDMAFIYAISPVTFLLNRFARLDSYVERQRSGIGWRLYRLSELKALLLYPPSLLLWLIFFGFLAVLMYLPVAAAGWVGGLWLGAAFFWVLALNSNGWNGIEAALALLPAPRLTAPGGIPPELGRIAKWIALAVTPHFLFLVAYNVFGDSGQISWPVLETVIKNYEYAAAILNALLLPVSDIEWYWWAAFAVLLLLLTWILSRPRILEAGLKMQRLLQSMIFAAAITASIGFAYTAPAPNWEPSLQKRLEAHLKDKLRYETTIELSAAVEQWFKANPARAIPLAALARNYEKVLSEAKESSEGYSREDINEAFKKSVRSLLPEDVLQAPPAAAATRRKLPGSTGELLDLDGKVGAGNRALGLKAAQIREVTVAFIAQIANVPVNSVPLLKDVLSELIDAAAENAGRQVLDGLPIEKGLNAVWSSDEAVKVAVSADAARIGPRIFEPEGVALEAATGGGLAVLRERFFARAKSVKAARIQVERARVRVRVPPL